MTAIECTADFPDDCLWDDDGEEVIRPGGMSLAEALASLFEEADMRVSDPEMDLEHHCWDFDVDWRGEYFDVHLQHSDTCLIVIDGGPSLLTRLLFWNAPKQADLAEHIRTLLAADPRFSDIRPFDIYR